MQQRMTGTHNLVPLPKDVYSNIPHQTWLLLVAPHSGNVQVANITTSRNSSWNGNIVPATSPSRTYCSGPESSLPHHVSETAFPNRKSQSCFNSARVTTPAWMLSVPQVSTRCILGTSIPAPAPYSALLGMGSYFLRN